MINGIQARTPSYFFRGNKGKDFPRSKDSKFINKLVLANRPDLFQEILDAVDLFNQLERDAKRPY
jgi:hypothetical protein